MYEWLEKLSHYFLFILSIFFLGYRHKLNECFEGFLGISAFVIIMEDTFNINYQMQKNMNGDSSKYFKNYVLISNFIIFKWKLYVSPNCRIIYIDSMPGSNFHFRHTEVLIN